MQNLSDRAGPAVKIARLTRRFLDEPTTGRRRFPIPESFTTRSPSASHTPWCARYQRGAGDLWREVMAGTFGVC